MHRKTEARILASQAQKARAGPTQPSSLWLRDYLEGQGDLVSRLLTGISRVTFWVIGIINCLLRLHDPPSRL